MKDLDNIKYDILIIGSGLGGLVCGLILAMEGKSVVILEKNAQIGGALQTFRRDGVKFDTGVHYVGSLDEGQPLHPYFNYLGILDKLTIEKLDVDGYDKVSFGKEGIEYPHAQGFENFVTQLLVYFPEEEEGLRKYVSLIKDTCDNFSLYNLEIEPNIEAEIALFEKSALELINSCTENKKLRAVLSGVNLLYAGSGDKTPFYVHALIVNHYMLSAYRFPKGGDQISKALEKQFRSYGGKIIRTAEVIKLNYEEGRIDKAIIKDGREFHADLFISNLHPQETITLFNTEGIRKSYINRIKSLKNTPSCFILYVVLKDNALPYRNYNNYHFDNEDVWSSTNYPKGKWANDFAIFYSKSSKNPDYCESISVLAYMNYEEVEAWKETINLRHNEMSRGQTYNEFKEEKAQHLLDKAEVLIPEIRKKLKSYHTSSPLTQRDYLNVSNGSLYGVERDFNSPLKSYLSSQTKVKNLFLTGQNLIMHGILGVTVGAVVTCSDIIGRPYLLKKIKDSL